ncbi:MAG TPA: NADH-quinone oxidoreductase subunit M [Candidatus Fraserbacteria bacterium]|nr:NADH-quinone oxidoreductase subunit M [Candidatus Fraserbacteria bacterium]
MSFPILSLIVFLPAAGALLIGLLDRGQERLIRTVALVASLSVFALAVVLFFAYDGARGGMQFVEQAPWVPQLGIGYHLGLDGISLLLLLLTGFIVPLALLAPWEAITERVKTFSIMVLLLETAVIGVFLSLDLVLFYVFWESMLIPMYFIIGIWGTPKAGPAALKFLLYTMAGSVFMLIAIIALYFLSGPLGGRSFDLITLQNLTPGWSLALQVPLFLAFTIAFAVKVPLWPFHSWLPAAYTEAPTTGTVLLAALLSKAGIYGFIRFAYPLFPQAAALFTPWLMGLALIGVIYGALVAAAQRDLKRLVAYSSISHLGLVLLGVFALSPISLSGSTLQMVNHGIIVAALFWAVAAISGRAGGARTLDDFGGLMRPMPRLAALFTVFMLAAIALPGTNGFVGEFMILLGTFTQHRVYAIIGAATVILTAIYMLWMTQRVFHEEPRSQKHFADLRPREVALLIPLVLVIFWIGIYPKPFLGRLNSSVQQIVRQSSVQVQTGYDLLRSQVYRLTRSQVNGPAPANLRPGGRPR